MSPCREAAKKAVAISSPRSFGSGKRGRAPRTCVRARVASCRHARRLPTDRRGDLLEADAEHVVEEERRTLER
jgi:hypothetical protein